MRKYDFSRNYIGQTITISDHPLNHMRENKNIPVLYMPVSFPLDTQQNIFTNQLNNAPITTSGSVTSQLNSIAGNMANHDNVIQNAATKLQNVASAQNVTYTITVDEADRLMDKKRNIDDALQGQNRMISLNDSYVKKYAKYNQIVMVIVLVILAILGAILLPTYLPFIPSFIGDLIIILAVAIGAISIFMIYIGIQARDPLYFDKLNIPAPSIKDISDNALDMSLNSIQTGLLGGMCIGQDCCTDPAQFINSKGKCVNPPPEIYDYATAKYKTCAGRQGCDVAPNEDPNLVNQKTWLFDTENNQWANLFTREYWDITNNTPKPFPVDTSPAAPTMDKQGFTTMNKVEPMQSSETSEYSFYR